MAPPPTVNFTLKTTFPPLSLTTKPERLKHVQNPLSASRLNDLAQNLVSPISIIGQFVAHNIQGNQLFGARNGIGYLFAVPPQDAHAIQYDLTAYLGLLQARPKRPKRQPVRADTGPSCSNLEIDLTVIKNLQEAWSKILDFCHEQEHDVGCILRLNDPELQGLKLSQALICKLREILRLTDEDMLRVGLSQDLIDMLQKLRSPREE